LRGVLRGTVGPAELPLGVTTRLPLLLLAAPFVAGLGATADPLTMVVCAPGYPGSTAEAQPAMDALAGAVAQDARVAPPAFSAVYYETEAAGLERLGRSDAALALVPLPFFLKHEARLRFVAQAQAVREGAQADEVWSLVAGKGRVRGPATLDGFEILSLAAYSPRFIRGPALGVWGVLPTDTRLVVSGALLSGLRRAAAGEKVALLLDGAEVAGLATLPFSKDLEVVAHSAPMPAHLVCTVAGRGGDGRVRAIVDAMLQLEKTPGGREVLLGLRLARFAPLDELSLKSARAAYAAAKDPF
jgi:hypothetical protein